MKRFLFCAVALAAAQFAALGAHAEEFSIAIKNGETLELGRLYWVSNCKSNLKSLPTAEILDGPANLSISVKQAMVLPRVQKCSKEVPGGILSLSAKDVTAVSTAKLILRTKYNTKDGERVRSQTYDVTMVP